MGDDVRADERVPGTVSGILPRAVLGTLLGCLVGCVAMVAGTLVAAPPAGAAAAPTTCTVARSMPGKAVPASTGSQQWVPFQLNEPDQRTPVSLEIQVDVRHPDPARFGIHVHAPAGAGQSQLFNYGAVTTSLDGVYTFSDAATTALGGASPTTGTYRPHTPLGPLVQQPPQGTWTVWAISSSLSAGEVRQVTLRFTYTDCPQPDTDRDGVPDAADNCPSLANADQANGDDDSTGDACDPDDDNDRVADADDACPTLAAARGCPVAGRTVKLSKAAGGRLEGAVRSATPACRSARVVLKRVRPGQDAVAARVRSTSKGTFKLKQPRRAGRYYATVAGRTISGVATCRTATSRKIAVRR